MSTPDRRNLFDDRAVVPGVTVIGLPGPTAGSISLADEAPQGLAVLTGDAGRPAKSFRRGSPGAAVGGEAAARSVRLVKIRADLVFPGHDRPLRETAGGPGAHLLPEGRPLGH